MGSIVIIGALFIVPLARLIAYPFKCHGRVCILLSGICGRWERATGWIRDYIGPVYLAAAAGWNIYLDNYVSAACAIILFALNEVHRILKRRSIRGLMEFARRNPAVDPREFFNYFYAAFGFSNIAYPQTAHHQLDPLEFDFRSTKQKQKMALLPTIRAALNMMAITRLILRAARWKDATYAREIASNLAAIHSARLCQLAMVRMKVENAEKLSDVRMPFIYLPNHTSAFDFNLLPTLLAAHRKMSHADISLVPRFLLASDHFLKNPILYRIIGIGRVAQILDMVFVERGKHGRAKTKQMVREAVDKLLADSMPLAIYPQGSRARSKVSWDGTRLDGGYYTVGPSKRLKREGGHLKKGAAFIATDVARALARKGVNGYVSLVPIAIIGAANVLPRKGIHCQMNHQVIIRVGDPLIVTTREVEHLADEGGTEGYADFVSALHQRIDRALKGTCRVHAELERRFFEDLRQSSDPHTLEELSIAMKQWRGDDYLVFAILDFIYACKPKEWRTMLGQLVHLIITDAPRESLVIFKDRIADKVSS